MQKITRLYVSCLLCWGEGGNLLVNNPGLIVVESYLVIVLLRSTKNCENRGNKLDGPNGESIANVQGLFGSKF